MAGRQVPLSSVPAKDSWLFHLALETCFPIGAPLPAQMQFCMSYGGLAQLLSRQCHAYAQDGSVVMNERRSALIYLHHRLHVFRNCTVVVLDVFPASPEVKVMVSSDVDSDNWRRSLRASFDSMHVVVKPSSLSDCAIYLGTLLPESVRLASEQDECFLVGVLRCMQGSSHSTLNEQLQSEA